MIGMAGVDLLRPVELLQQHAAHEEVRPGHRAQRDDRVGALEDRGREPFRAADREGEGGSAAVARSRLDQAAPVWSSATSRAPPGRAAMISSASRSFSAAGGNRRFSSSSMIVIGGESRPA